MLYCIIKPEVYFGCLGHICAPGWESWLCIRISWCKLGLSVAVKGKRLVHLGSVVGAVNINYYFVIIYAVFVTPKFFIF